MLPSNLQNNKEDLSAAYSHTRYKENSILQKAVLLILCTCFCLPFGDIIHLKNGGKIEGKIINKTESQIIMNVGFGEMEVDTAEIAGIEWDNNNIQAEIEQEWESIGQAGKQIEKEDTEKVPAKNEQADSIEEKSIKAEIIPEKDATIKNIKVEKISVKTEEKVKPGIKQSISFQTSFAEAGTFAIGIATRNQELLKKSNIHKDKFRNISESVEIGIYFPTTFSLNKSWPLFIVMGPGIETGIAEINAYVKYADKLGFILAASELPPDVDNEESRYYYTLHIIEYLKEEGHIGSKPVLIGGLNGGGQWALHIGACGGNLFSGIIAIGCNEDFATTGYKHMLNESALEVPICLLNGTKDNDASSGSESYLKMVESIKKTGFSRVKEVHYEGGHTIPQKETIEAFKWLTNGSQ